MYGLFSKKHRTDDQYELILVDESWGSLEEIAHAFGVHKWTVGSLPVIRRSEDKTIIIKKLRVVR